MWRAQEETLACDLFLAIRSFPVLYPAGLTREVQLALGILVIVLNAVVYALVLHRRRVVLNGGNGPSA